MATATRLSAFGTTIFTEMSALAERTGAINLGQGFPDEDGPAEVLEAAQAAIRAGRNQYAPLPGVPALRAAIAERVASGDVPLSDVDALDDDAAIAALSRVKGVGRWTAQIFLMFRLGRPDVLPVDDYAVRKGFALVYGEAEMPRPKELARYGERWRPFRTAASWYLWRAHELPPGTLPLKRRRKSG